jgi:Putative MetA-pathway of phenol degradation
MRDSAPRPVGGRLDNLCWIGGVLLVHTLLIHPGAGRAQELDPRSYAANPVGAAFALAAFRYSTGSVLFDPTLPFSDVTADFYSVSAGFGGTFALFTRTASGAVLIPYAWGTVKGKVAEQLDSIERSGFADARLRLAVNLVGGKALRLPEFAQRRPGTIVGTSVTIVLPTGQYFPDKLINLGTNRWAFKPEVGLSQPVGKWTLELYGGCWFFTQNSSFFGGQVKQERPLLSLQSHIGYTFKPRLWITGDATFYSGGRTVVEGQPAAERQESTRLGLTFSLPVGRVNSVKFAWSTGATTRLGGDFDAFTLGWQTTFIGRAKAPTPP